MFQESLKVSQGLFKRFSKKFQGCSKENERVSLGSFKGLSREFKGNVSSFKITRLFYKASNELKWKFQKCIRQDLELFLRSFKCVSRVSQRFFQKVQENVECFKEVLFIFPWCWEASSALLKCLKGVQECFKDVLFCNFVVTWQSLQLTI